MEGKASSRRMDAGQPAMLVVTANWQIGDGSILAPQAPGAGGRFVADLRRSAVREGWRPDGRYEPVRSLDVVLAGDTLDPLLSREWLGSSRPWERGATARAAAERVLAGCLAGAARTFGELSRLVHEGLDVPAADARGRPAASRTTTATVRVTLLEGNLDAGLGRDAAVAIRALPGIVVGTRWEGEGVRVEHGHDSDPAWCGGGLATGAVPSPGASLRVDLLGRFAAASLPDTARPIRDRLVGRLAGGEIGTWPALLSAALATPGRAAGDGAEADLLRASWRDAVGGWRRAARRTGLLLDAPFDAVDALATLLLGDGGGEELAALVRPPSPAGTLAHVGTIVLGHPAADRSRPWDRPRVICLGGEAEAEPAPPGVLEIHPAMGRSQPPSLVVHGAQADGAADALPVRAGRPGGRPRMIESARGTRHRIVDAA